MIGWYFDVVVGFLIRTVIRFVKILAVYLPLVLIHPAIAGLDACRYRWTSMPFALVHPGALLLYGALALIVWALVVNPFAEASVRINWTQPSL